MTHRLRPGAVHGDLDHQVHHVGSSLRLDPVAIHDAAQLTRTAGGVRQTVPLGDVVVVQLRVKPGGLSDLHLPCHRPGVLPVDEDHWHSADSDDVPRAGVAVAQHHIVRADVPQPGGLPASTRWWVVGLRCLVKFAQHGADPSNPFISPRVRVRARPCNPPDCHSTLIVQAVSDHARGTLETHSLQVEQQVDHSRAPCAGWLENDVVSHRGRRGLVTAAPHNRYLLGLTVESFVVCWRHPGRLPAATAGVD